MKFFFLSLKWICPQIFYRGTSDFEFLSISINLIDPLSPEETLKIYEVGSPFLIQIPPHPPPGCQKIYSLGLLVNIFQKCVRYTFSVLVIWKFLNFSLTFSLHFVQCTVVVIFFVSVWTKDHLLRDKIENSYKSLKINQCWPGSGVGPGRRVIPTTFFHPDPGK